MMSDEVDWTGSIGMRARQNTVWPCIPRHLAHPLLPFFFFFLFTLYDFLTFFFFIFNPDSSCSPLCIFLSAYLWYFLLGGHTSHKSDGHWSQLIGSISSCKSKSFPRFHVRLDSICRFSSSLPVSIAGDFVFYLLLFISLN